MNESKVWASKAGNIGRIYFFTYVALCVLYSTAVLVGYIKGVQVVVRETQYVKEVQAVSPLGE